MMRTSAWLNVIPFFLLFVPSLAIVVTVTAAPAIPSSEPSYANPRLFTSAILNSTNTYRSQHNATSLRWNDTLASFASSYLASAAVGPGCNFQHSGGPYGENLAIGYQNATAAVEAWGDERDEYNFAEPGFTHETGHFTQLVWKDTTDVGCYSRLCGVRGWYLVCEYWPRGNVGGEYSAEVDRQVRTGALTISTATARDAPAAATTTATLTATMIKATTTGTIPAGTGSAPKGATAKVGDEKHGSKTAVVMIALSSMLLQIILIISGAYLYTTTMK